MRRACPCHYILAVNVFRNRHVLDDLLPVFPPLSTVFSMTTTSTLVMISHDDYGVTDVRLIISPIVRGCVVTPIVVRWIIICWIIVRWMVVGIIRIIIQILKGGIFKISWTGV